MMVILQLLEENLRLLRKMMVFMLMAKCRLMMEQLQLLVVKE